MLARPTFLELETEAELDGQRATHRRALACDVRVASPNAVFAHPGVQLGIITGWGGTQRLPRLIGTARALEMFILARRLNAQEAYAIGLVNRVAEAGIEAAGEIIDALSRSSSRAS